MGVGIPGTGGMIGLPIAIALGALVGRSEYQLEVLRDTTPEAVERGREYIDWKCISIGLKEGITEKLYIEVEVEASGHRAVAVIAGVIRTSSTWSTTARCCSTTDAPPRMRRRRARCPSRCAASGTLR